MSLKSKMTTLAVMNASIQSYIVHVAELEKAILDMEKEMKRIGDEDEPDDINLWRLEEILSDILPTFRAPLSTN